jgi:SagB-type dehydrogenase family enzyme
MADNIGKEFMRKTAHPSLSPPGERTGILQPSLQLQTPEGVIRVALPEPNLPSESKLDLLSAFERRRSFRDYSEEALSLVELSFLLWSTQGVQEINDRPSTLRTVPSAGARHAFETYLLIRRVGNLKPGLYRYAALEHELIELDLTTETANEIALACRGSRPLCERSAVTFFWVAISERMTWRYSERGFRFLLLDAGHVCQNLYLAAEVISSGVCAIGGFNDNDINPLLGLDGDNHFVIYIATVGKK